MQTSHSTSKPIVYPECVNKKQARMVCLSSKCQLHPFFCTACDQPSCQTMHTHEDKPTSISFKEFTKRVLKQPKPIEQLSQAMSSYKQILQKLKMDVNQFVQKQLEQLEQIQKNVCYVPEEDQVLIGRLKFTQYEGFNGKIMDHLWTSVMETTEKKQTQE